MARRRAHPYRRNNANQNRQNRQNQRNGERRENARRAREREERGNAGIVGPQAPLPSARDIDASANTSEVAQLFGHPGEVFRGEIDRLLFRRGIEDQRFRNFQLHENNILRTWEREIQEDVSHHAAGISQLINQQLNVNDHTQQSEQKHREIIDLISASVTRLLIASGTSREDSPDLFNSIMIVAQIEYNWNGWRVEMLEARRDYMNLFNTLIDHFQLTGIIERRDRQPLAEELNLNESRRIRMFYEAICWKEANLRKLLNIARELNVGRVEQAITEYFTQNEAHRNWLHQYFLDGQATPPTPGATANVYHYGNRILRVLNGIDVWCRASIDMAREGRQNRQPLPPTRVPQFDLRQNVPPRV